MILQWLGAGFAAGRKLQALCLRHYWISRFGRAGRGISIGDSFQAYAPERIQVGDGVVIANRVTLRALVTYPWSAPPQSFTPELILEDHCFINHGTQVSCARRIVIGANVLIAENGYIADHNHGYRNPDLSIRAQPLEAAGEVQIGADSWIGANCVIAGNVQIGRHCVVGANSVVTADIPDFCVAAGAPARILKRYNRENGAWVNENFKTGCR
jgi:acetyltransferase-like isoleucine patch superfamily enzyme